jgi:hypothetical protein
MKDFCSTVKEPKIAQDLYRVISGKGAFRRFKDTIHRHSVEERWYKFRDEAFE